MTKNEQIRLTHWRFKVLQQAGEARSVARTCRHHGISRNTFYKWRRRFAETWRGWALQPAGEAAPFAPSQTA